MSHKLSECSLNHAGECVFCGRIQPKPTTDSNELYTFRESVEADIYRLLEEREDTGKKVSRASVKRTLDSIEAECTKRLDSERDAWHYMHKIAKEQAVKEAQQSLLNELEIDKAIQTKLEDVAAQNYDRELGTYDFDGIAEDVLEARDEHIALSNHVSKDGEDI